MKKFTSTKSHIWNWVFKNISSFSVSLAYFINMLSPCSNHTRKGIWNGRWTCSWTGNFPTKLRALSTFSNLKFANNQFLLLFYINIQIFWVHLIIRWNYFKQLKVAFIYIFEYLLNLPYWFVLSQISSKCKWNGLWNGLWTSK